MTDFFEHRIEAGLEQAAIDPRDTEILLGVFQRFSEIEAEWNRRFEPLEARLELEARLQVQESGVEEQRNENQR